MLLGDDSLLMSQRLQLWLTRLPELEEETAVANIALDLLGQARMLLARAGAADGSGRSDDDLAFRRPAAQFRHVRLVEAEDRDFADLMTRLLVFSLWRLATCRGLSASTDPVLAAISGKAVKELSYHVEHAAAWVQRLGDGTPESRDRVLAALDRWWPVVGELFVDGDVVCRLPGVAIGFATVQEPVVAAIRQVLSEAGLTVADPAPTAEDGRDHADPSPELVDVVTTMQSVARALPGATW